MQNQKICPVAILLSLSLLGGCAQPNASQPTVPLPGSSVVATPSPTAAPDDDMRYVINFSDGTLIYDSRGRTVAEEEVFSTRKDILTGEPLFKTFRRIDIEEQRDENGYPVSHIMTSVYDLEDKLLHDWAAYEYTNVFGDYAIRMDSALYYNMGWDDPDLDEYVALWNYKTGQEVMKGVARAKKLDGRSVMLEGMGGKLLGIMEIGGAEPIFRPAPDGYLNADEWYGYILAEVRTDEPHMGKDRTSTLMDRNYQPIFSADRVNGGYIGLHGRYLLANAADGSRTVLDEKGATIFKAPNPEEGIDYFDGEIVILYKVENIDGDRIFNRTMLTVEGAQLADGYKNLTYKDSYDRDKREPAEHFVGVRKDAVDILDRSGKVTHTTAIPGLESISMLENGLYSYRLLPESEISDENGQTADGVQGLLDSELNIILPADRYTYIEQCTGWSTGEYRQYDIFRGVRTASGGVTRWDIMDMYGKVLIENLTQIGDVGPNRVAAVKGFNVGLLDWQGNWITKQSIFIKMEDEKGDIFG